MNVDDQDPSPEIFKKWLLGDPSAQTVEKRAGLLALRGLSVQEFARRARVTSASIYNYIAGHSRPSNLTLHQICSALQVPYEEGRAHIRPAKVGRPFGSRKVDTPAVKEGNLRKYELRSRRQRVRRERERWIKESAISNAIEQEKRTTNQ